MLAVPVRQLRISGRHRGRRGPTCLARLIALYVLSGCASGPGASFERVPPQQSSIRVEHPAFDPARAVYRVRRDPDTGNAWSVAEINGPRAFGVVVASRMQPGHEVVRQPTATWIRGIVPRDYRLAWGAQGQAGAQFGPMPYRLFQMGDVRGPAFACVAFSRRRGSAMNDVLYGYFCRHADRPLKPAQAERMVSSLTIAQ